MLTVLQIERQRPQGFHRRLRRLFCRKGAVSSRIISLPDGHYLLITAKENRRGLVDWDEIRRIAGGEATHLLMLSDITPPPDSGISPFNGQALRQALLKATALHLLTTLPALSRRRIVIDDPDGCHTQLADALIPLSADLRILTVHPDAYATTVTTAMEEYGACLPITNNKAITADAALVLAPDGPTDETSPPRGWLLSGKSTSKSRAITGYLPSDASRYLLYCPSDIDGWAFLAGLYERSHIDELGTKPPQTVYAENRPLTIRDLAWRLAGLDIGLTV